MRLLLWALLDRQSLFTNSKAWTESCLTKPVIFLATYSVRPCNAICHLLFHSPDLFRQWFAGWSRKSTWSLKAVQEADLRGSDTHCSSDNSSVTLDRNQGANLSANTGLSQLEEKELIPQIREISWLPSLHAAHVWDTNRLRVLMWTRTDMLQQDLSNRQKTLPWALIFLWGETPAEINPVPKEQSNVQQNTNIVSNSHTEQKKASFLKKLSSTTYTHYHERVFKGFQDLEPSPSQSNSSVCNSNNFGFALLFFSLIVSKENYFTWKIPI